MEKLYNPFNVEFDLLSTIRYDPNLTPAPPSSASDITRQNFFLFSEHFQRLLFTLKYFQIQMLEEDKADAENFSVTEDFILERLIESIDKSPLSVTQPMKVRVLVSLQGELKIELYTTPERPNLLEAVKKRDGVDINAGDIWDVRVDTEQTLISPFTSFKTTNRSLQTAARNRGIPGLKPGLEEVIMVNQEGIVMEGSITNIAINRDGAWVTPDLSSGCLCGVVRHYLIHEKFLNEGKILKLELTPGTEVLLFNGVMGLVRGYIVD